MRPALIIFTAWVLFGGSHLLFSASPLRGWIVDRFGLRSFTLLFAGVTLATMLILIGVTVVYGGTGRPGFNFASYGAAHWFLVSVISAGTVLLIAGLINFPRSPMAILGQRQRAKAKHADFTLNPPSAIERVARHPFFFGLAIMMSGHALLASTLASAVYFAGFAVMAGIGIPLQDRKLRARWKAIYAAFEDNTSNIPFASKAAQRGESDGRRWTLSVIVTIVLFGGLHPIWARANGAPFAMMILMFGLLAVIKGFTADTDKNQP